MLKESHLKYNNSLKSIYSKLLVKLCLTILSRLKAYCGRVTEIIGVGVWSSVTVRYMEEGVWNDGEMRYVVVYGPFHTMTFFHLYLVNDKYIYKG